MDKQHPSPSGRDDVPPLMPERYDLEPEPGLQPEVQDVLEVLAVALEKACEEAEPERATARCLTILVRVQAASRQRYGGDELIRSLERLVRDWRTS